MTRDPAADGRPLWPFLAGLAAGAAGAVLLSAATARRGLDVRLVAARRDDPDIPLTVLVPGILGSQLVAPDGTQVWFNFGNAVGAHDLALPFRVPLAEARDELCPAGLLGIDTILPRLFGFTEYADVTRLLEEAGFARTGRHPLRPGAAYHWFTYDWRRDLVESARRLGEALDELADSLGDPQARFNLVGHSMGGLVARYYLRYGGAEPGPESPVTWAGARRVRSLVLAAVPCSGSIPALDTLLSGSRVGLSSTTLSVATVASMPSLYQLLPPPGTRPLASLEGQLLDEDLHDPETWERHGWGAWAPARRRAAEIEEGLPEPAQFRAFATAALQRARAFHEALARPPQLPCPVPVVLMGGDCLPTLARALVGGRPGTPPRFDAWTRAEARFMFEAGDGRVTRASLLGSHLPASEHADTGSGWPEVSQAFFGAADHHGIYGEATFQSILLRRLLRPAPRRRARAEEDDHGAVAVR